VERVRAKKHLGQHFLKDENIAQDIVKSLSLKGYQNVLEVGPGMGVLTKYLLENKKIDTRVVEIDNESIEFLNNNYPDLKNKIISHDFLQMNFQKIYSDKLFAVIGNFPYNISSQILFKVLDHKSQIPEVVGMFQKEVAERIASKPGNKSYGIISVLLQAWYDIEYLFTVDENVFSPPPKVKSAVIRLTRNKTDQLNCDEDLFKKVVKTAFNQRRKMLRNSVQSFFLKEKEIPNFKFATLRPEQLSVNDFVELTNFIAEK